MVQQTFHVLNGLMWERSPAVTPKISCLLNSYTFLGEEKTFAGFVDA